MFIRKVSWRVHKYLHLTGLPRFISQYKPEEQYRILLRGTWATMSPTFKERLLGRLREGSFNTVKQWYYTANGCVLPYLLGMGEKQSYDYSVIDRLTKWCLEGCATNFAQFISRLKSCKKAIRKAYATESEIPSFRDMGAYLYAYRTFDTQKGPELRAQYVLLWTQSRATGLADSAMMQRSLKKFEDTITQQPRVIKVVDTVLRDSCAAFRAVRGLKAHVSAGPAACLQSTREAGGQTAFLQRLVRHKVLHRVYNFNTLNYEAIEPRSVRSASDLLSWAIQEVHENPLKVKVVRVHAVAEPSKARVITVSHYAVNVILGVMAHLFAPCMTWTRVRSGMRADRHLWNVCQKMLHPQEKFWGDMRDYAPVYALSTDLEEATDYGNPSVGRAIWTEMLRVARGNKDFPLGLGILAKTIHMQNRVVLLPLRGGYRPVIKRRGWFMGDMMTKIILTVAHDMAIRKARPTISSIVGDDEVSFDNSQEKLESVLQNLADLDFKVSEPDTFISKVLAFYCEEGTLVPQNIRETTSFRMKRREPLSYIDVPRIRLLIPCRVETDNYSSTDIGRFSLLGKECGWVISNNPTLAGIFRIASLYQHMLVPRDATTHCPFTPTEIGGDGSYYDDPAFIEKVYEVKSRRWTETKYRIHQLMSGTWAFRLVRNDRLNEVVHKYHIMVPKLKALIDILPEESVLIPRNENQRIMMSALRTNKISSPEKVLFRLMQSAYWKALFKGVQDLPTLALVGERSDTTLGGPELHIDVDGFLRHWRNPGFTAKDRDTYWVKNDQLDIVDPRCLQWTFNNDDAGKLLTETWVQDNLGLFDRSVEDVLDRIYSGTELPESVRYRLNLYFESDVYIKEMLTKTPPRDLILVSQDRKLALEILRMCRARTGQQHRLLLEWPPYHIIGRTDEVKNLNSQRIDAFSDALVIEDPGAMYWSMANDMWNFEISKSGTDYDIRFDSILKIARVKHSPGLFTLRVIGYNPPDGFLWDGDTPPAPLYLKEEESRNPAPKAQSMNIYDVLADFESDEGA